MIETGEGGAEFVNTTANTYLVTKQFGKDPHSREGIFTLKMSIIATTSSRAWARVSESGHPFTDSCKAPEVRGDAVVESPLLHGHSGRSVQVVSSFHSSSVTALFAPWFVPASSARYAPKAEVFLNSAYNPGIK